MNALVTIEAALTVGPHGEGHTVFSPWRQSEVLASPPAVRQCPARLLRSAFDLGFTTTSVVYGMQPFDQVLFKRRSLMRFVNRDRMENSYVLPSLLPACIFDASFFLVPAEARSRSSPDICSA